jgi:ubiquinone/menaquinone biosynthesis C-methylase UbiE
VDDTGVGQTWAQAFNDTFAADESDVQAQVWSEVLGEEYPTELAPYSYTTRSELAQIAKAVKVGPTDLLIDIGSGRGGPGLWVAAETGARYLAVDIAVSGLEEVERRAAKLGLADRVRVAEGSFQDLPLADGEAAAIMSIDALLFSPDKEAAAREMARVLQPKGRLVLTTWDYHRQPVGRPPQVADHRPLLADAGLRVLAYDETPDWQQRQRAIDRLLMQRVDDIAAEADEPVEVVRADLAEMAATVDCMIRRVLVVAERT